MKEAYEEEKRKKDQRYKYVTGKEAGRITGTVQRPGGGFGSGMKNAGML
jgi:hypothetical protein